MRAQPRIMLWQQLLCCMLHPWWHPAPTCPGLPTHQPCFKLIHHITPCLLQPPRPAHHHDEPDTGDSPGDGAQRPQCPHGSQRAHPLHPAAVLPHGDKHRVPSKHHHSIKQIPGVGQVGEDTPQGHHAQDHLQGENGVEGQVWWQAGAQRWAVEGEGGGGGGGQQHISLGLAVHQWGIMVQSYDGHSTMLHDTSLPSCFTAPHTLYWWTQMHISRWTVIPRPRPPARLPQSTAQKGQAPGSRPPCAYLRCPRLH